MDEGRSRALSSFINRPQSSINVSSSIVNRASRCSCRAVDPTLDFVGVMERVVGYRDDAIF
jgi:hypothetical protein